MREDTKKAVQEYVDSAFLFKKDIERTEGFVNDDEKVILVLTPTFSINYPDPTKSFAATGVLFVTDKRMIVAYKRSKELLSESVPLDNIQKVQLLNIPMRGTHIQAHTYEKIFDFQFVPKVKSLTLTSSSSAKTAANKAYQAFLYAKSPNGFEHLKAPEPDKKAEPNTADIPEQIEKLAALKEKGIISEDEFNAKKAELLSRL